MTSPEISNPSFGEIAGLETYLSGKTEYFSPATRPIAPSEWAKSLASENVFLLQEKRKIRAVLRIIERSGEIWEIGSIISQVRGGAHTLLEGVLKIFPDRDFALITRKENERMRVLAEKFGFEEVFYGGHKGFQEIFEKDGKDSDSNRILLARIVNHSSFSLLQ